MSISDAFAITYQIVWSAALFGLSTGLLLSFLSKGTKIQ